MTRSPNTHYDRAQSGVEIMKRSSIEKFLVVWAAATVTFGAVIWSLFGLNDDIANAFVRDSTFYVGVAIATLAVSAVIALFVWKNLDRLD